MFAVQVAEHGRAAAEHHRDDVQPDLVNETALEELTGNVGASDGNLPITRQLLRGFIRSFDASHEGVDTVRRNVLRDAVRNDDGWHPNRAHWSVCFPVRNGKILGGSSGDCRTG